MNRETVDCAVCGARANEPCLFPSPATEPWTVMEDGVERRTVHADRYARTLPADQRSAFWATAVETYLAKELAALKDDGVR